MKLTPAQRSMASGAEGPAREEAMQILITVGHACRAPNMIAVASAHVGLSLSSLGAAGVAWLERLAASGVQVAVPTTTNVLSFEPPARGAVLQADADTPAALQYRALHALTRMGADANCSCNPFIQGRLPAPGSSVAWSESATAPFLNGVLGARSNREGATALAAALTGFTPCYGMHEPSARRARVVIETDARLDGMHRYHLLAVLVAQACSGRVPVIAGLDRQALGRDGLYGFCASFAAYSSLAIFHIAGVTPEAPCVESALMLGAQAGPGNAAALRAEAEHIASHPLHIGDAQLDACADALDRHKGRVAQCAVIGCPHASLAQLQVVAQALAAREVAPGHTLWVHTNATVETQARRAGLWDVLLRAGVRLTTHSCVYAALETCPAGTPMLTDSGKMAFLMASRGLATAVASTEQCVLAVTR